MEPTPAPRALVAARLVAVAGSVLALGSGAHVAGGGAAPSLAVALLVAVVVLPVAAVVARRPLTAPVLLPVTVAAQVGVHVALTWLGPGSGGGAAPGVRGGHEVHGVPAVHGSGAAGMPGAHAGAAHGLAAGLPMLAAHVAAMVVLVLLLVATERGLLALVRGWATVLLALTGAPVVRTAAHPAGLPDDAPRRPGLPVLRGGVGRRGPPLLPLLATAA